MALNGISYYQILGKPLIMYLGIFTLLFILLSAVVALLNKKGIHAIPFEWHNRLAAVGIILAIIHGILGVAAYL